MPEPAARRALAAIAPLRCDEQLTPMGTIVEGEWAEVMAVVTACFETLATDCSRIGVHLKVDYRAGPAGRLQSKTAKVEQRLGRKLNT